MPRIERQTTISASPEAVFAYVSDISRHPEWAAQPLEMEPASAGPPAVGSVFKCVGHQFGSHAGEVTITELVPNEKVTFEANDDSGHFRHGFVIQQKDGKVLLVKTLEPLQMRGPLKLLSPIAKSVIMPRGLDGDLKRIKAKLEGAAAK
jgi:uncharacterized protein YndB with AHSA1/START domain